jgi:hypothetical protein
MRAPPSVIPIRERLERICETGENRNLVVSKYHEAGESAVLGREKRSAAHRLASTDGDDTAGSRSADHPLRITPVRESLAFSERAT